MEDPDTHSSLKEAFAPQAERFRREFGRDPGPDDPVFWKKGPNGEPVELSREDVEDVSIEVASKMVEMGHPDFAYAYLKTGLIVTEENIPFLEPGELEEWTAAVSEYRQRPSA